MKLTALPQARTVMKTMNQQPVRTHTRTTHNRAHSAHNEKSRAATATRGPAGPRFCRRRGRGCFRSAYALKDGGARAHREGEAKRQTTRRATRKTGNKRKQTRHKNTPHFRDGPAVLRCQRRRRRRHRHRQLNAYTSLRRYGNTDSEDDGQRRPKPHISSHS